MDLVLVSITAVSLVLAIAMGVIVLKLLAEERRRAEARVALLEAATVPDPAWDPYDPLSRDDVSARFREDAPAGDLFVAAEPERLWGRRAAVAACLAAVVVTSAYALTLLRGEERTTSAAARTYPLELMELRHAHQDGVLTITGVVHNPRTASPVSQVSATAVLFNADGTFLGSGRAALDYATLGPGDQSQFVVAVPVKGSSVSRYRVGFRAADGSVIEHVDRRDGESARNAGTTGGAPWAR